MAQRWHSCQADMKLMWEVCQRYKELCDMRIAVGKRCSRRIVNCHRFMLLVRCSFFRCLWESLGNGIQQMNVEFLSFPGGADSLQSVLRFCYGETIEFSTSTILSLHSAASFLGMHKQDNSNEDNLMELCDNYWKDQVLTSSTAIFQVLNTINDVNDSHIAESVKHEYFQQCSSALCVHAANLFVEEGIKDEEAVAFLEGLVDLSSTPVLVRILSQLRTEVQRIDVWKTSACFAVASESFFLYAEGKCQISDEIVHRVGLVAEFLLQMFRMGLDFGVQKEAIFLPRIDEDGLTSVTQVLALYDFFLSQNLEDETKEEIRVMQMRFFRILSSSPAYSLCSISPQSALLLVSSFVEQHATHATSRKSRILGVALLEDYLASCSEPLAVSEFLAIAKFISKHGGSHDALQDQLSKFINENRELCEEEIRTLLSTVDSAKLSHEKFKETMVTNVFFKREIAALKNKLKRKCRYCVDTLSYSSESEESALHEECSSYSDSSEQPLKRLNQLDEEDGIAKEQVKKNELSMGDMVVRKEDFYISVTSQRTSYSFMVASNDSIEKIEKKLSFKLSAPASQWYLTYNQKKLMSCKTVAYYNITNFSTLNLRSNQTNSTCEHLHSEDLSFKCCN